uniref:Reverse transcriptase Ty1/copia-type domain-containing protein n=1 Tax=Tanacetum cinerariifolium TaxID=118510 RepID=A0A6L2P4N1_TANCI|nr:hypothetical protein [Tanacetum cinerariifolium]
MKLIQFLMGLDDTYMQIRSYVLSRETLPDVKSAYAIISSEESYRIAIGSVSRTSQRSQTSSFNVNALNGGNFQRSQTSTSFSRPSNNNRPNDNGNKRTAGGSNLVCEDCGFNGHTIDKCFKVIGYPAGFRKRKSGSNLKGKNISNNVVGYSSSNRFSDEQMATLISLIKENSVNRKGVHSNMAVTHPNETGAFITRIENMPLTNYLTLYDVLVVPEYYVSLMSVHKVVRDSKLLIAFDEMHCYVMNQDLRKGKILGTGRQISGLYYFDGNQVYNKPPSLKHLRSFGYLAYATILNSHDKFRSRDVKFFKDIFPFKQNNSIGIDKSVQDVNHLNFFNFNTLYDLPKISNDKERRNLSPIRHGNSPSHSGSTYAFSNENDARNSQDADAFASENESFAADEDKNSSSEGNGLYDQSQNNVSQDTNGVKNLRRNYCFSTMLNNGVEPKTYLEASQHKHWVDAMNDEMDALYRNNTWEIVDLPVGRKAVGSKWVWKIKYKSDGEIERYKARLVTKGFNQREGIYYDETFSYVVKIVTVRCLINLVVQSGWSLFQMDINNAFLYGDLEETIYMTLPPGYFLNNETKLTKIEKVKQFLKTKFMIKDLGKLKYFIGIEVLDTPKGICLNQIKYCLELIDEFRLLARKPSNLPMQPNISLTSEPSDTDPLLDNVTEYQKLIGKLIYLTTTRTDIAYVVSCLSQFMHNPLKSHPKTALKVIMYLKGSPGKGINVIKGSTSSIDLKAYSYAYWARCADTRRQMMDGKLMLVDDDGKPLNKVDSNAVNSDSYCDVEVAYDESAQFMASGGANDARLYEDEDYDIY